MSDGRSGVDSDLFELNIEEEYKCSICLCVIRDACQLNCGHKFCRYCITSWLTEGQQQCPIDRRDADSSSIRSADNAFLRIVKKFKLKCPNWSNGCRQKIEYKDLETHERNCSFPCAAQQTTHRSALFSATQTQTAPITITVKINNVRNKLFQCFPNDTVKKLKRKIFESEGIRVKEQNLVFGTKVLNNDGKMLSEYRVTNGSIIYFTERYIGGHCLMRE